MAKTVIAAEFTLNSSAAEGSVKSLKQQLREAQAEVSAMSDKFGETSMQAAEAAKKAAALKDRIGDAKALTDAFNPDKKFQAFSSALSGVAGGFAAVQGAMALMGSESQDVEKALLKVQSAMALAQGLSAVTESIDAFKNLGTKLKELPIIQKAITTAQWLWNAAMDANPIGAIIAAITLLIAGIVALTKYFMSNAAAAKQQAKSVEESTKALDREAKTLERNNEQFNKAQKYKLDLAKATGASTAAIRALELKLIDEKIAFEKSARATAYSTYEKEKNKLASLRAADADDDLIKKQFDNVKKSVEQVNNQTKNIQSAYDERKDIQMRHNVEVAQEQTTANQKSLQKINDNAEKQRAALKEANDKLNQETKQLNDEVELLKIKDEDERAKAKLKRDYENKKKEIEQSKGNEKLKQDELNVLKDKYSLDLEKLEKDISDKKLKTDVEKAKEIEKAKGDAVLAAITDENYKKQYQIDLARQAEIDKQAEFYAKGLINAEEYNAAVLGINKNYDSQQTQLAKETAEAKKKIEQEKFNNQFQLLEKSSGIITQFSTIVGKETVAGKALAIAAATMDTYVAANKALKADYSVFGPAAQVARIASVAATIGLGIKNVREIAKVKVPGGGGGSVPSGLSSTAAPIGAQMGGTALQQAQINATGNAAVQAFVLESDVSGNQERIERLNRAARIQ